MASIYYSNFQPEYIIFPLSIFGFILQCWNSTGAIKPATHLSPLSFYVKLNLKLKAEKHFSLSRKPPFK